jgi:copper chaperone CopZ
LLEIPDAAGRLATAIILVMTQLEALYRYEYHPSENVMLALGKLREVYGVRHMKLDPEQKTILVEYDGTRLTNLVVAELLRRAGLTIEEELSLIPPPPVEAAAQAPAPSK